MVNSFSRIFLGHVEELIQVVLNSPTLSVGGWMPQRRRKDSGGLKQPIVQLCKVLTSFILLAYVVFHDF